MEKIGEKLVEKLIIPPLEFIDRSGKKIKDWIKFNEIKKKIETGKQKSNSFWRIVF